MVEVRNVLTKRPVTLKLQEEAEEEGMSTYLKQNGLIKLIC